MLVDGAGELLADIMTASPSLSGVEDTATSSILDASNYMIQAISFGTGSYYFNQGARSLDEVKKELINVYAAFLNSEVVGVVPFLHTPSKELFEAYNPDFTNSVAGSSLNISGYVVDPPRMDQLPTPPDPSLKTLEYDTNTSALLGTVLANRDASVSSVFPGNGQHCNFLPSAIFSSMVENTAFSATLSSYYGCASLLGAFPDGSSTPYSNAASPIRLFYGESSDPTDRQTTQNCEGLFNEASSMDVSGFVNAVMSSVPAAPGVYDMSSDSSGLVLSAQAEELNEGFPFVEYSVRLGKGDVGHVNFFGGIYHLGLWTIDMNKSLQNGNSPPFAFSVLNNPRKYRLFCRKGLSKNLCFINDEAAGTVSNFKDLVIKWRIHFR